MKIFELTKPAYKDYILKIVSLHKKAFPYFFLTNLGTGFLSTLYQGYLEDADSGILVAENKKGMLMGFLAYSKNYSKFYKELLKRHFIRFTFYSLIAFLKNPFLLTRLLKALKKSKEVEREENYVELASIGVLPKAEGRGVGSSLIKSLKQSIDFNMYEYISLETDAINNERVNQFYQNNGFVLVRTFRTREGRWMNEYHYRQK